MKDRGAYLQLELFEGGLSRSRDPWGGRSPRALTRVALSLTLKAQAAKSVSGDGDPEQYDLWLPIQKAPWRYQGAPLLLDLEG